MMTAIAAILVVCAVVYVMVSGTLVVIGTFFYYDAVWSWEREEATQLVRASLVWPFKALGLVARAIKGE